LKQNLNRSLAAAPAPAGSPFAAALVPLAVHGTWDEEVPDVLA